MPETATLTDVASYGSQWLDYATAETEPYIGTGGTWKLVVKTYFPATKIEGRWIRTRTLAATMEPGEALLAWKNDSSTTEDELVNEDEVQELIFRIRILPSVRCREDLAKRLLTLLKDAKEEDPSGSGISVGSLRSLYHLFDTHPNLKCPALSLTPDNNIYASWRREGRLFSAHFLPNGNVRFVVLKPNDRHPERELRISGEATVDILLETLASHGIWEWIADDGGYGSRPGSHWAILRSQNRTRWRNPGNGVSARRGV